jgi:hypothetical protein
MSSLLVAPILLLRSLKSEESFEAQASRRASGRKSSHRDIAGWCGEAAVRQDGLLREAKKSGANLVSFAPRVNPRNIAERRGNLTL